MMVLSFLFVLGNMVSPNEVQAKKAKEVKMVFAAPGYPEYGEGIGLNMYRNALEGRALSHPALKGKFKVTVFGGTLFKKAPKDAGPDAFTQWENLFIQTLSTLPFLKEKLHEKLERIGTEAPPFLKEEDKALAGKLHEIAQDFGRSYRDVLPLWAEGQGL